MIKRFIERVRLELGDSCMIIVSLYNKRIRSYLNSENTAFIVSGKMYESVKLAAQYITESDWGEYENEKMTWRFGEVGYKRKFVENILQRDLHAANDNEKRLVSFGPCKTRKYYPYKY